MDISSFLRHYESFPCLWDRGHADYKSRAAREAAEASLLPVSGLATVRELRQKIRNIRCTYNQELNKVRRSGNLYVPKLAWFPLADSFLRRNTTHIKPDLNGDYPYVKQETMDCSGSEHDSGESRTKEEGYPCDFGPVVEMGDAGPVGSLPAGSEFSVFGQHVAVQLQQLPLEQALRLEEQIQSLITRARLASLHRL